MNRIFFSQGDSPVKGFSYRKVIILTKKAVKRNNNPNEVLIALNLPQNVDNGRSTVQEDVMNILLYEE